jgi:hypothetical protein
MEDMDRIFCSGLYFLGAREMYLNKWTPNFSPENDVPSVVSVWVWLPHLPLHCWSDDALRLETPLEVILIGQNLRRTSFPVQGYGLR